MTINRPLLRRHVVEFLRSDEGLPIFDEIEISPLMRLFATVLALVITLIAILSIVGARDGLRALWGILKGETLRDPNAHLRDSPEELRPMIARGIIMGSHGHAIVLGTFDEAVESDREYLAAKTVELGNLYEKGCRSPRDKEIVKLLKDDVYRHNRRRRVPDTHSEGRLLWLFDVQLKKEDGYFDGSDDVLIACVVTPGEEGIIQQIPWHVVKYAVIPS